MDENEITIKDYNVQKALAKLILDNIDNVEFLETHKTEIDPFLIFCEFDDEEQRINPYWHLQDIVNNHFDFCRVFKDKISWGSLSQWATLTEDFMREFCDYLEWNWIEHNQHFSEQFARDYIDRMDINILIGQQNLSEQFYRDYADRIAPWGWLQIIENSIPFSKQFFDDFKDKFQPKKSSKNDFNTDDPELPF